MKKIHRFLVQQNLPAEGPITITDPEVVHVVSGVLRIQAGEQVIFFTDGSPDFVTTLTVASKKFVSGEVVSVFGNDTTPTKEVAAAVAITKQNFDTIVQKLTELGVSTIIPLLTDRTVKKDARLDRLQKISNEALEQCGGNRVVKIYEPMSLEKALADFTDYEKISFDTVEANKGTATNDKTIFFIGPEGGWSDAERELLHKETNVFSLGNRILKADTAAIVAAYELLR
jgi:16S rRNA (uracil1498-N3)-methyltransferase